MNCIFVYAIPIRLANLKIPISVLVLIHNRNQEVLLLERADRPGFWQSVTGSLDEIDEPLEGAAIREVAEETGIDIQALPLGALQNLHHAVEYEIYPSWRYRYPIRNIGLHSKFPQVLRFGWLHASICSMFGYPIKRPPRNVFLIQTGMPFCGFMTIYLH
ncbi:MAG: hypothetical protein RLZZ202_406 [Pseudomonadota bacterium]